MALLTVKNTRGIDGLFLLSQSHQEGRGGVGALQTFGFGIHFCHHSSSSSSSSFHTVFLHAQRKLGGGVCLSRCLPGAATATATPLLVLVFSLGSPLLPVPPSPLPLGGPGPVAAPAAAAAAAEAVLSAGGEAVLPDAQLGVRAVELRVDGAAAVQVGQQVPEGVNVADGAPQGGDLGVLLLLHLRVAELETAMNSQENKTEIMYPPVRNSIFLSLSLFLSHLREEPVVRYAPLEPLEGLVDLPHPVPLPGVGVLAPVPAERRRPPAPGGGRPSLCRR